MARRHDAVAVQQQHCHADELFDLGQRVFVIIVAAFEVFAGGLGQLGQIGQGFIALFGQGRAVLARAQPEAAQERTCPGEQRIGLCSGVAGIAQQQFEREIAVFQLRHAGIEQARQGVTFGRSGQVVIGQYAGRPFTHRRTAGGQPAAQAAVQFSGAGAQAQGLAGLVYVVDTREFGHLEATVCERHSVAIHPCPPGCGGPPPARVPARRPGGPQPP